MQSFSTPCIDRRVQNKANFRNVRSDINFCKDLTDVLQHYGRGFSCSLRRQHEEYETKTEHEIADLQLLTCCLLEHLIIKSWCAPYLHGAMHDVLYSEKAYITKTD